MWRKAIRVIEGLLYILDILEMVLARHSIAHAQCLVS